ncbi:MAG: hypothetical protein JOZ65_03895 [Chloroflexi bacterium]|nr:hypothetical protein [Chloroflexota bacterium]
MWMRLLRLAGVLLVSATQPSTVAAYDIADRNLSANQTRIVFVNACYRVDQLEVWDWLSPPVVTFQVHDVARNHIVLVVVYPDVPQAQQGSERMVEGYSASTWIDNLALFEANEVDYRQVQMAALARSLGMLQPDLSAASLPPKRVDAEYTSLLLDVLEGKPE